MLQVMSIQRLNDLSRLIKAFEFFHEKDVLAIHMQLQDEIVRPKSIKKWKRLIAGPCKEASELTDFMMGYLPLLDSKGPGSEFDDDGKKNLVCEADWDYSLCSLDEKSLHVALWWLFCQNSNVWCAHSTKKHLKKFFSYLFLFSFPSPNNDKGVVNGNAKVSSYQSVNLYRISVEYLQDTISYEQMIQYTKVSSRFCHVLKKLLSPILLRTLSSNLDLDSSPNWVELLNILEKEPVMIKAADGLDLHYGSSFSVSSSVLPRLRCLEHSNRQSSFPFSFELKACESLLNLFCNLPRLHCNKKSFSKYSNYIFNIERLLVSILLNHHDESFLYDPFEILKLFVSCRRAMKFLVMGSAEKLGVEELKSLNIFFDRPSSVLWLFKSVYKVAGIPSFFEGRDSVRVQDMIYSLVDHTSYVFFKMSEAKTDATFLFLLKDKFNRDPLPQTLDNLNDNDNSPGSSRTCNEWEHVELAAEVLKEYAENFLVTFRSRVDIAKLDYCCKSPEWSEFSSIISCFQALLLGLAFSSDSMLKEMSLEDRKISGLMPFFVSKLGSHIVVFEDLVELCLNILIFGSCHVAEHFLTVKDDPSSTGCADETTKLYTPTDMPTSSCFLAEHNSLKSASVSTSGNRKPGNSTFRKKRSPASHIKQAINFFHIVNKVDVTKFKVSYGSFLQCLLKDLSPQVAFILRQLFITSATILRIKCSPSYSMQLKYRPHSCRPILKSAGIIFATSCTILQEFFELTGRPCEFSFAWLDGVLTFLDVVGSLFSLVDPDISKDVYTHLIDLHLKAMGKCISLQGKTAILSSQDVEFDANIVEEQNETSWNYPRPLEHGKYCLEAFKTKLRMSIEKYIMIQSTVYLDIAIQVIERNLSGYHLCTGMDGGMVSSAAAASIECLELILECFSGNIQFIKKSIPSLAGAVINTVLHLQNPSNFYAVRNYHGENKVDTDAGAVILMCVEVLTKIAGRRSFHMDPCHVNQCFHIPMMCFVGFHKLKASRLDCNYSDLPLNEGKYPLSGRQLNFVDHHYAVVLYTSCCRLMCSALKNQKRQAERCIPLLEESVTTMLSCLEVVDSDSAKRDGFFSWELPEAIKCASFLRRIYEEIRHQKEVLGKYAYLLLSNYISIFSGCGPAKAGIRREIDEALRPGVYSLIDICTRVDLQRLHSLLNEGPCRSTLANLLHDYQHNFQYDGKV